MSEIGLNGPYNEPIHRTAVLPNGLLHTLNWDILIKGLNLIGDCQGPRNRFCPAQIQGGGRNELDVDQVRASSTKTEAGGIVLRMQ